MTRKKGTLLDIYLASSNYLFRTEVGELKKRKFLSSKCDKILIAPLFNGKTNKDIDTYTCWRPSLNVYAREELGIPFDLIKGPIYC